MNLYGLAYFNLLVIGCYTMHIRILESNLLVGKFISTINDVPIIIIM